MIGAENQGIKRTGVDHILFTPNCSFFYLRKLQYDTCLLGFSSGYPKVILSF
jgi:hypothetical protein